MNEKSEASQVSDNPMFAEVFVRDASKTIAILEEFTARHSPHSEEEIRTYVIHTHGVKSALANMGRTKLAAAALKLEQLGRDGNIEAITAETPAFLESLRDCVNQLRPTEAQGSEDAADEDIPYLTDKLLAIIAACEEYDGDAVEGVLLELRKKTWSRRTGDLLDAIAEKSLHSEFDEIANDITDFIHEGDNDHG